MSSLFLQSVNSRFKSYKTLADKTFEQLDEKDLFFQPNPVSNSIAILIQHMSGNMLSRFTNFLTEDGEKKWRKRDAEFEATAVSKSQLLDVWEKGWGCLFDTLRQLNEEDLGKTIYIRNEPLTVIDAINRQLTHYAYHVGQIVYIGKVLRNKEWKNLSM